MRSVVQLHAFLTSLLIRNKWPLINKCLRAITISFAFALLLPYQSYVLITHESFKCSLQAINTFFAPLVWRQFLRHLWPWLDSCTYPVKVKISHFLYFSRKLRDVVFPVLISSRARVAISCSTSCFKVDCLESALFLRLQFVPQREQYLRYEHNRHKCSRMFM